MPHIMCPYAKAAMITKYGEKVLPRLEEVFSRAEYHPISTKPSITPDEILVNDFGMSENTAMILVDMLECKPKMCGKYQYCGGCHD